MAAAQTGHSRELLVLCQLFYPELVSTGQTLTELCEQLAERGLAIEVVCGMPTVLPGSAKVNRRIEYKTIRIRRVWGTKFDKLKLWGRISNQITFAVSAFVYLALKGRQRPILVLTNPPFLAIACAVLRLLRLGGPYIYLVFDVYPDTAANMGLIKDKGVISRLWGRCNRLVFRHASYVVVIGRCMEEVIRRKTVSIPRFDQKKIRRTHIWCDNASMPQPAEEQRTFRQQWNLSDQLVLGYLGNMGRFHDIETIMHAAEMLRDRHDIVFLFVGEGHKKGWAIQHAERMQLSNCRFHTYVAREELAALFSTADVGLVSLAAKQEGLSVPSKAIALMAAALPVLAVMNSKSEIARILDEEDCGLRVEPGDPCGLRNAIVRICDDEHLRRQMGQNAHRAIRRKYSLQRAAESFEELINSLDRTAPEVPSADA